MSAVLDDQRIGDFVADWYRALDEHAPLEAVRGYLAEDELSMTFPEGVLTGGEEFAGWYDTVTRRFFDEIHEVVSVEPAVSADGARADVRVVVNWQARIWDPPAATSQWIGFDAYQTWEVVAGKDGRPVIRSYVVDDLKPMPGSPEL